MRALQFLPLALLFLTSAVPTKAQEGAAEARVVVREGAPLTVECALRVEQPAQWRRDGGAVPSDMRSAEAPAGRQFTARLHAAAARASHAGLYSCGSEPWQRVRVLVQPAPAAAPAPAPASAPAVVAAPPEAAAKVPETTAIVPTIENPHPQFVAELSRQFSLNCSKLQNAEPDTIVWKKNGTEVEKIVDLANRYKLEENGAIFHLTARSNEDDFGTYTCGKRGVSGEANGWEVRITTHAKMSAHTNVVEGQKLKLQCKLIGKPYPRVMWTYRNNTDEENGTDVSLVLGDRVILQKSEQQVENAELIIESAQRSDAGVYTCVPESGAEAFTTVRVKDMYAALWPFLGICAEVLVLCVIILVYEKRRTKPELDDSDTDNHDQKKS